MIDLQNKSGFSLFETIAAMGIVAAMAVPLAVMQSSTLQRVVRDANRVDRIFLMRNFLYEARNAAPADATTFTFEKTDKDSKTELCYKLMSPPENSSLHVKGMYIEQVTAQWYILGKKTEDILVTARYIEPESTKAQP
jgi:type II secretory pathway pseudopilin PulG